MHIRKYVKWRQIENGSVLFNTQTGDWLTLNKNATFIFLQRYVNYNPMENIAENLVMKYPAMINFLNDIRNAENPISNNRKLINTIAILFLGIALGTFSKYLDFRQTELPGVLMAINGVLDIGNFLGRFAIWILIALCISIYSNSAIRASINVFVFFVGMVASYYLYSNYIAGFFPRSYAMIWFGFTAVSPLLAFVCWYAKGKSKLAFILSALILAVLFNMCFVYGCWYFNAKSVLEVIVFIIGLIVLRRDTLRSSALMGTISIVLAVLLDMVIPFHFG